MPKEVAASRKGERWRRRLGRKHTHTIAWGVLSSERQTPFELIYKILSEIHIFHSGHTHTQKRKTVIYMSFAKILVTKNNGK